MVLQICFQNGLLQICCMWERVKNTYLSKRFMCIKPLPDAYAFWGICSKQLLKTLRKIFNVNPFPHTTILQQSTSNIFCQKIENLYNWTDNLWLKVENIVAKEEIARFKQFLLVSLIVFKKLSIAEESESVHMWEKG